VLHNVNSGAFEVYDIAGNTLVGAASLGAVGLDWQLGGFAADPPTGSVGDSSVSQLVQAMAGFGGGSDAAESLKTVALGADTSQQQYDAATRLKLGPTPVRFSRGLRGETLHCQDFEWAYVSIGSFTMDAVEAKRACMSAVALKRTNSRWSRYVRFVPIAT
jgi:hypothetical protein